MNEENKLEKTVEKCKKQLRYFPDVVEYLHNRKITDEIIDSFDIGFGQLYGALWIIIPIRGVEGNVLFLKLRRDPRSNNDKQPKFRFYPQGSQANIYGYDTLLEENETLYVSEGEFDRMLLISNGLPAITSTAGAGTFKEEWLKAFNGVKEVILVFDRDEAGANGRDKLAQKIYDEFIAIKVYKLTLPEEVGEHGDVTDFFVKTDGNIDKLLATKELIERREIPTDEELQTNINYEFDGKQITDKDIEIASKADCSKFVKIVKNDSNNRKWALCPFHNEKTPSFCCHDGGNGYYCYGCNCGGDAIDLVQKLHGLDFMGAVLFILQNI
jgi:hypothetical protein